MKLKTLIPKSEVRKLAVKRRAEFREEDIRLKAKRIEERILGMDEFRYAKNIFCYIGSRPGEVETRKLIDIIDSSGRSVFIPKLNKRSGNFHRFHFMGWDEIITNTEGWKEPKLAMEEELTDIDLFIIPALAVSLSGHRVGYGGGYYDKLLKQTFAPKVVLAYEFQVFSYIESSSRDIKVDKIVTERRIINTRETEVFQPENRNP